MNKVMSFSKGCASLFGAIFLLANIVEFIQLISIYLFLDIALPKNLRIILQKLYESLNIQILPIDFPDPFPSSATFNPQPFFESYGFNYDFINSNFYAILELILIFLFYTTMRYFTLNIILNGSLKKFFTARFRFSLYSNSMQAICSAQIALSFASATCLTDRSFTSYYKILNYTTALTCVFVTTGLVLLHPLYLFNTKFSDKIQSK